MDQIMFWGSTRRDLRPARTSTNFVTQPLSPASTSTNAGAGTLIEYLPNHKFLICAQRKGAVPGSDLKIHPRWSHRGIKKAWLDSVREKFEHLPRIKMSTDLQPLPDGSLPLLFLIPSREVYRCPHYPVFRLGFRTLHETELLRHSSKAHDGKMEPSAVEKHVSYLQGWVKRHVVQAKRY
jgi:hypothetical protein